MWGSLGKNFCMHVFSFYLSESETRPKRCYERSAYILAARHCSDCCSLTLWLTRSSVPELSLRTRLFRAVSFQSFSTILFNFRRQTKLVISGLLSVSNCVGLLHLFMIMSWVYLQAIIRTGRRNKHLLFCWVSNYIDTKSLRTSPYICKLLNIRPTTEVRDF